MKRPSNQPLHPVILAVAVLALSAPMADPSVGTILPCSAAVGRAWVKNDGNEESRANQWLATLADAARQLHGQHFALTTASVPPAVFALEPAYFVTAHQSVLRSPTALLANHLVDLPPPLV